VYYQTRVLSFFAVVLLRGTFPTKNAKRNHRRLLTVHALDKSTDRYKLLKRRMDGLVPQGMVRCYNMDFLQMKPSNDRGRNIII
jgi:hypothetical protein